MAARRPSSSSSSRTRSHSAPAPTRTPIRPIAARARRAAAASWARMASSTWAARPSASERNTPTSRSASSTSPIAARRPNAAGSTRASAMPTTPGPSVAGITVVRRPGSGSQRSSARSSAPAPIGFTTRSSIPASSIAARSSGPLLAVSATIAIRGEPAAASRRRISRAVAGPSSPGIIPSRNSMSNGSAASRSSASAPPATTVASMSWRPSRRATTRRLSALSSATSTRGRRVGSIGLTVAGAPDPHYPPSVDGGTWPATRS